MYNTDLAKHGLTKNGWNGSGPWKRSWRRSSRSWKELRSRSLDSTVTLSLILCGECVKRHIPNQCYMRFTWVGDPPLGMKRWQDEKQGACKCMSVLIWSHCSILVPWSKNINIYKCCVVLQPTPVWHTSSTTPGLIQRLAATSHGRSRAWASWICQNGGWRGQTLG